MMARRRARGRWWRIATVRPGLVRLFLAIDLFVLGDATAFVVYNRPPTPVRVGSIPLALAAPAGSTGSADGFNSIQPPPIHLDIASINVHTNLVDLAVNSDGSLEVPRAYDVAGWYSRGVAPGGNGSAVIVGHVDSDKQAAVFYELRNVKPGSTVDVMRLDRSKVTFAVDGVKQYSKDDFPTALVYGASDSPQLRLITCGGRFDRQRRVYTDNIVVFAHLVASEIPSEQRISA